VSDPVLIQPVESPVICKPYYEPTQYWEYDRNTGRAQKMEGRRAASYWYKDPAADIRRGQMTLELEEARRDLVLVNRLRSDVSTGGNGAGKARRTSRRTYFGIGGARIGRDGSSSASWRRQRRSSS